MGEEVESIYNAINFRDDEWTPEATGAVERSRPRAGRRGRALREAAEELAKRGHRSAVTRLRDRANRIEATR
jgi:hypothetical protein